MKRTLEKILLVDDDVDIQGIVRLALEVVGDFTVRACSSGPEALSVAETFEPDLILLDVLMPKMDGPTTLKELRKLRKLRKTPVFFLTAMSDAADIGALKKLGAQDVIPKPIDPMTLSKTLTDMWNHI